MIDPPPETTNRKQFFEKETKAGGWWLGVWRPMTTLKMARKSEVHPTPVTKQIACRKLKAEEKLLRW
jgi:hypothetical protein